MICGRCLSRSAELAVDRSIVIQMSLSRRLLFAAVVEGRSCLWRKDTSKDYNNVIKWYKWYNRQKKSIHITLFLFKFDIFPFLNWVGSRAIYWRQFQLRPCTVLVSISMVICRIIDWRDKSRLNKSFGFENPHHGGCFQLSDAPKSEIGVISIKKFRKQKLCSREFRILSVFMDNFRVQQFIVSKREKGTFYKFNDNSYINLYTSYEQNS